MPEVFSRFTSQSGVYWQVLNQGQAPQLVAAPHMGVVPLQQPLLPQVQHSGGGTSVIHSGGMQQLLSGIPSGGSSMGFSQGGLQQVADSTKSYSGF